MKYFTRARHLSLLCIFSLHGLNNTLNELWWTHLNRHNIIELGDNIMIVDTANKFIHISRSDLKLLDPISMYIYLGPTGETYDYL